MSRKLLYPVGVLGLVAVVAIVLVVAQQQPRQGPLDAVRESDVGGAESVQVETAGTVEPDRGSDDSVTSEPVEVILESRMPYHLFDVTATLEEMIVKSDVIARVRLRSVEPVGVRSAREYDPWGDGASYTGSLQLRLEVLEYLKGAGGPEISAVAYGWLDRARHEGLGNGLVASTETEAAELGRRLLDTRDKRWDDREAVVLLRYNESEAHYYLGSVRGDSTWDYPKFTVASAMWKAWLPDAVPGSATSTSAVRGSAGGAQRFLLDDPDQVAPASSVPRGDSSRTAAAATSVPSIAMDELKALVRDLVREYEGGDGSMEYKACVIAKYEWESRSRRDTALTGGRYRFEPNTHTLSSGEPAGTWVYELPEARLNIREYGDTPPANIGDIWTEGRDRDLLLADWPDVIETARPLPAGEYRVFLLFRPRVYVPCDAYPEAEKTRLKHVLTVTAPAGTLAESFFDPYAAGAAVTGTTTVGDDLMAGGPHGHRRTWTVDVTGHALDFIGLDGTTTLSLIVADAAETDGTLNWTVPTQPWSAGDKLMLRVRRHDAP